MFGPFLGARADFLLHIIVGRPGDEQEAKETKSEGKRKARHRVAEAGAVRTLVSLTFGLPFSWPCVTHWPN